MVAEQEAQFFQPMDILFRDLGGVTAERMETVFLCAVQIGVGLQRGAVQ